MVPTKSVNPTITDFNDPKFTDLVNHPDRWLMNCLIGDADTYFGRGYEQIHAVHKLSAKVSVGDFVTLGNRAGVVVKVIEDTDSDSDGGIIGLEVNEDMRYLPLDYWDNPAAFGYDDDPTKRNRTVTYVFGKETELDGVRNGGGVVMLFQGTLQVMRQYTNDPNSWNSVAQAAAKFQEQQNPTPPVVSGP